MNQNKLYQCYLNFSYTLIFFIPLILLPKGTFELKYNLFNYPELFNFFNTVTYFGDGMILLAGLILVIAINGKKKKKRFKKELFSFLFSVLLMITIITTLKNAVFFDSARPIRYFADQFINVDLSNYQIKFHKFRSFPSGHSATFSVLGFFFMRYLDKSYQKHLVFMLILLVGFSRIFLFQHFILDVIIGIAFGLIAVITGNIFSIYLLKSKKLRLKSKPNLVETSLYEI